MLFNIECRKFVLPVIAALAVGACSPVSPSINKERVGTKDNAKKEAAPGTENVEKQGNAELKAQTNFIQFQVETQVLSADETDKTVAHAADGSIVLKVLAGDPRLAGFQASKAIELKSTSVLVRRALVLYTIRDAESFRENLNEIKFRPAFPTVLSGKSVEGEKEMTWTLDLDEALPEELRKELLGQLDSVTVVLMDAPKLKDRNENKSRR